MKLDERYRNIYRDILLLHNMFVDMGDTAEDYAKCAAKMQELSDHYKSDEFVMDMLVAVYSELERKRMHGRQTK